jgi:hypothetical protein
MEDNAFGEKAARARILFNFFSSIDEWEAADQ